MQTPSIEATWWNRDASLDGSSTGPRARAQSTRCVIVPRPPRAVDDVRVTVRIPYHTCAKARDPHRNFKTLTWVCTRPLIINRLCGFINRKCGFLKKPPRRPRPLPSVYVRTAHRVRSCQCGGSEPNRGTGTERKANGCGIDRIQCGDNGQERAPVTVTVTVTEL